MQDNNHEELKQESRKEKLESKFKDKPYHLKYKNQYYASILLGFLGSFLSGIGAFSFTYFSILGLCQNEIISLVSGVIFVLIWETLKRYSITTLMTDFWKSKRLDIGGTAVALLIIGLSAIATYQGINIAIKDILSDPDLIEFEKDSKLVKETIKTRKAELESFLSDNSNYTKEHGKLVMLHKVIPTRDNIKNNIINLENELLELQKNVKASNLQTEISHKVIVSKKASNYSFFGFSMDLLILICLFFVEKIEYREAVFLGVIKRKETKNGNGNRKKNVFQKRLNGSNKNAINVSSETDKRLINAFENDYINVTKTFNSSIDADINVLKEENKRLCKCCGNVLNNKRKNAKYCDATCKNKFHSLNKTE